MRQRSVVRVVPLQAGVLLETFEGRFAAEPGGTA